MSETQKPFDRREAFELFMLNIRRAEDNLTAVKTALEMAQLFQKECDESLRSGELLRGNPAKVKTGYFIPYLTRLYFEDIDRQQTLVAIYSTPKGCTTAARQMNSLLGERLSRVTEISSQEYLLPQEPNTNFGEEE